MDEMNVLNIENIEKVLDEHVRPALIMHGGNVAVEDLVDGVLSIRMTGNCSACMSVDSTVEGLVNSALKQQFPDLKSIELVTGVSDSLISEAMAFLKNRHK